METIKEIIFINFNKNLDQMDYIYFLIIGIFWLGFYPLAYFFIISAIESQTYTLAAISFFSLTALYFYILLWANVCGRIRNINPEYKAKLISISGMFLFLLPPLMPFIGIAILSLSFFDRKKIRSA